MAALYTAVKDDLLEKIKSGRYAEGELIPSELELADQYGVSRSTVRQALGILEKDGYLDRRKRRGTVVTVPSAPAPASAESEEREDFFTHDSTNGFDEQGIAGGSTIVTIPIVAKETRANEEVAQALNLELGDPVYKLTRLRYLDGVPNLFTENYIPAALYPGFLDDVDFASQRMHDHMADLGRPVKELRNRINVINADESIAMMLDVAEGDPLFLFHIFGSDAEGNLVEYSISTYRGNGNTFEFTVVRSLILSNEELLG